jgi:hypothetical protein
VTDGRSTPQDLLDFQRARLPEYLVPATMTVLDHCGAEVRYASVPGRTTGWLIQAKGWLIQLRPTGRDELTE